MKAKMFRPLFAALTLSACFVACGPSTSDQIVGAYTYESVDHEPASEEEFAYDTSLNETDTFAEDKSYTEEGTQSILYYVEDPEEGINTTVKLNFSFHRTGTWDIEYSDAKEWLVITGKEANWSFAGYELAEENEMLKMMAEEMVPELLGNLRDADSDWAGEHNFVVISVTEKKFTYESASEVIEMRRIQE